MDPDTSAQVDPSDSPQILVVSGRYPATEFQSPANHKAFCEHHGYRYIHANWPTRHRNRYLNKIEYVLDCFDYSDWLFWIDDDAFFVDFEQSLTDLMPKHDSAFMSVCSSPTYKAISTKISSGQFLMRTSPSAYEFLSLVRDTDPDTVGAWWTADLGYFTGGDQDCMIYLMQTDDRFRDAIEIRPYEQFNSRIDDIQAGRPVFLVHFTGETWIKRRDAKRASEMLKRGPELIPREIETSYVLKHPRPWIVRKLGELRRMVLRIARRTRLVA